MQGLIPDNTIEEIKQRADIVDVVSEYVTLKKAGRNFLGICPFHKEKTPSFTVNREKQMFYCFGCGEGGHVFTFLMKIGDMSFPETARHLAGKLGIIIPERPLNPRERQQYGVREQIDRINEMAAAFFVKNLFSPAGADAREYLKKRGISESVVREFRLGYAEDAWRSLRNFFEQKKVPLKLAAQAGLVVSKNDAPGEGDLYDRFRGRLMFPIEDTSGRVIAFGGRTIGRGEPKYLNSPETPVFSKGRHLYGLNRAREGIRINGHALFVEGYFDLIALRNVGIANVVATLGTALTKEQVALMRRYTEHAAVLFDADEAGRKALERSLQLFLAGGIQAKAVVLPDKYDPDDYVRKFGREKLEQIIARAPSLVDYYIEFIVGKREGLEEKRNAAREALSFISILDDAIERDLFLKRIAEKLGIGQEILQREARRLSSASSAKSPEAGGGKTGSLEQRLELSLIIFMLQHPEKAMQVQESGVLEFFSDNALKSLGESVLASSGEERKSYPHSLFLDRLEDNPLKEKLLKAIFEEPEGDDNTKRKFLADAIRQIKKKWYRQRKKRLAADLFRAQESGDRELCNRIMLEKNRLLQEESMVL